MADYEIRQGGMVVASVSGTAGAAHSALNEAIHYFNQYMLDATEDEPVQLVQLFELHTTEKGFK